MKESLDKLNKFAYSLFSMKSSEINAENRSLLYYSGFKFIENDSENINVYYIIEKDGIKEEYSFSYNINDSKFNLPSEIPENFSELPQIYLSLNDGKIIQGRLCFIKESDSTKDISHLLIETVNNLCKKYNISIENTLECITFNMKLNKILC